MSTQTFSSTPAAALIRFVLALLTTLFLFGGVIFTGWAVMVFGSPWLLFFLLGLPCFLCGCIFAKGTWDNWFDYRRIALLATHYGGIEGLLASELTTYRLEIGKPGYVVFDDFFHWLDQKKSILDTSNVMDAIMQLEAAGEIRREYPEGGGLIIHLLPGFQRRPVFALAPPRHD